MSSRLRDNINSQWVDAANALRGKNARRRIVAYVESYDDIYFWRTVLSRFENDRRYFEVMLPSKMNLTRGKKSVLMNFIRGERCEVRGEKSEVRGERCEVRGEKSEVRGERCEVRGEKQEVRGEKCEVRGEKSEVRGERCEVRGEKQEMRGERCEVRGEKQEVRGEKCEVRGERCEVRGEKSEVRGERCDSASKGNLSPLTSHLSPLGEDMIACVDSDYDYLMQGATDQSRKVLQSPFVFQTYVYAIENYQCYAPSLHDVCVAVTLNDHRIFDFRDYFQRFSEAIFPLFVWNIMLYRNGNYPRFSISDFNRIADPGGFTVQNPDASINNVKRKVGVKIRELQRQFPDAKDEYLRTKDDIRRLGVTPQTTYLYIQGHHLFDTVVAPILTKVCNQLRQERQAEIYHAQAHRTQKKNEMSCYENSRQDIKTMLKKNTGYQQCPLFVRMQDDVERYLKKMPTKSPTPPAATVQPVVSAEDACREDHGASSGGGCSYSPHTS